MNYLGIPPESYEKPLVAQENLNDVLDKTQARANLGAASSDDVLKAANPIGTIIAFYGSTAPYGYLPCSGQTVSKAAFPDLVNFLNPTGTSATLPDLRGEFLRGWDNGRGADAGRSLGDWQRHSTYLPYKIQGHLWGMSPTGDINNIPTSIAATDDHQVSGTTTVANVTDWTSAETRPRNVAVMYCIKAYGTTVNQASVDVAALASEVDLKVALTAFTGTNQSLEYNGYQKLPGGAIFQWGRGATVTGKDDTVTFPVAFPTTCRSLNITEVNSKGWMDSASPTVYGPNSITRTGFLIRGVYIVPGSLPAYRGGLGYTWTAIGY